MTYEEAVKEQVEITKSDKAGFMECYQITEEEYALALECMENLDTQKGYEAYAKLEMSVERRDGDTAILFDAAADFRWDNALNKAVTAIHKASGYYEERKAKYPDELVDEEEGDEE